MRQRDYIEKLREWGLLHVVDTEVDWNLEMAGIDAMFGRLGGSTLLFTNVRGYPGQSILARHLTGTSEKPWRNIALLLGLSPQVGWSEVLEELWKRFNSPVKPTLVSTGPCKENKAFGKDVDLFKFPWPFMHQGDGGRYVTFSLGITKSRGIDWTNWGNYRHQVQTKTKISTLLQPVQHIGYMYFQEYERNDLPMPACIVIGGPVESLLVSCTKIPFGISEVDWVGGLAQEPVELVKAETSDLLIPADAEIVIEGEYRPYERMDEGPFGEFVGYMHGPRVPRPVFRAHCITWRNNPIIPTQLAEGLPGSGSLFGVGRVVMSYPFAVTLKSLGIYARHLNAKNAFLPGAKLPPGISPEFVAQRTLSFPLFQTFNAYMIASWDTDIDETDEVIEAIFCKAHPNKFHSTEPDLQRSTFAVHLTPEERKRGYGPKYWMDTTWPMHWPAEKIPQKVTFENSFPPNIQEWVAQSWRRLGLEGEPKLKG